ncbi:MAG: phosphate regulon transcriptional regulatory protein PhoB [Bacteroidota bacterium]|jgi:two-component system phosphate regulon response regulator PhoB
MIPKIARVLVCEDDETLLTIFRYHLKMDGVELVFTEDGKLGKQAMEEQEPFHLIISDLLMPEMSGIEFIRYIREVRKEKMPIIAISSGDNLKEIEEAYHYGIDDFVAKPFRPREIAFRVRVMLQRHYPELFKQVEMAS